MVSELIVLGVIGAALFLFGGPKVMEWASNLGKAKKAYKQAEADPITQPIKE